MRRALFLVAVLSSAACRSPTTREQELCARAAEMFGKCESFDDSGSNAAIVKELTLDRWRGLCRAVITGRTEQLMANSLELFQSMDEETKAGLRVQAECAAKTTTCAEYKRCDE